MNCTVCHIFAYTIKMWTVKQISEIREHSYSCPQNKVEKFWVLKLLKICSVYPFYVFGIPSWNSWKCFTFFFFFKFLSDSTTHTQWMVKLLYRASSSISYSVFVAVLVVFFGQIIIFTLTKLLNVFIRTDQKIMNYNWTNWCCVLLLLSWIGY